MKECMEIILQTRSERFNINLEEMEKNSQTILYQEWKKYFGA